jgi:hypothetical protein
VMCVDFDTENVLRGGNVSTLMFYVGNPTKGETCSGSMISVWVDCQHLMVWR